MELIFTDTTIYGNSINLIVHVFSSYCHYIFFIANKLFSKVSKVSKRSIYTFSSPSNLEITNVYYLLIRGILQNNLYHWFTSDCVSIVRLTITCTRRNNTLIDLCEILLIGFFFAVSSVLQIIINQIKLEC